jgi:putative Ca2+/H+ antiporter (TMEM165/GDT1 family)
MMNEYVIGVAVGFALGFLFRSVIAVVKFDRIHSRKDNEQDTNGQ